MENMDNLDDFLKKRLNSFDEPIEDWAKPNPGDWEKAASKIPMFHKTPFWSWSNIGWMSVSVVLVCSIFYIWQLRKEVAILKENVQLQSTQQEEILQNVEQIFEEKYKEQSKAVETENEEDSQDNINQDLQKETQKDLQKNTQKQDIEKDKILKKQNKNILREGKLSKSITQQRDSKMNDFSKSQNKSAETASLELDFFENNSQKATNKILDKNEISKEILSEITQEPIAESDNVKTISSGNVDKKENRIQGNVDKIEKLSLIKLSPILDEKQEKFQWEIDYEPTLMSRRLPSIRLPNINFRNVQLGYEYRMQSMKVPSVVEIKELETFSDKYDTETVIDVHALTLSVPLNKNWAIETGVRFSERPIKFEKYASAIYKTENEYTLPDGTIGKTLNIEQESPFSIANTEVQLLFDEDEKLEEGDEFGWYSKGFQEQRTLQIPLGVSYQFGKKKWKWLVGGGVQWNNLQLGDINYRIKLEEENGDYYVIDTETEVISEIERLNYFSAYATFGVQYQFWAHWSVRGGLTYNYHFLNQNKVEFWNNTDKALSLGLQYHF